ncbi:ABC transporter permease [Paenibacillus sp. R14(2021)]|uniref:ABC transporter permease n=1 Tax=Paenibacillus sp. R14(2021) TaxID=2859228 RepID=UPI001C613669|nr:ABC transporter permease subunit [Paenibacillus sp. R14(2021)]
MRQNSIRHRKSFIVWHAILIVLFFVPFIPLLAWSLAKGWRFPDLLPTVSWRAWHYVLSPHSQVKDAIIHSLGLAAATSLLAALIAYPAARALGLYVKRWGKTIRLLLIAPLLLPGISIAIGVHVLFLKLGLADRWLGVLLSHLIQAIPYAVYLMHGFYAGYDIGYEKQVRLLGANRLQTFYFVELPLLRPVLSLSLLFSFLISWSQYLVTVFVGGGNLVTVPMLLFSSLASGDNSLVGALCMLFVMPALLIVIFSAMALKKDRYDGSYNGTCNGSFDGKEAGGAEPIH